MPKKRSDPEGDLSELWVEYECDPHFAHLRLPGINFVPGDGPTTAAVMIVGEAPGATENGARRPFVGASGRLLEALLNAAGWDREAVYITNTLKYRPPSNRTPTGQELEHSLPYLRQEWAIIRPVLTVAVGRVAHLALRGPTTPLSATPRGQLFPLGDGGAMVASQYHPAFGMRQGPRALARMAEEWELMGKEFRDA